MRWVLVMDRALKGRDRRCMFCCEPIGDVYLREIGTCLIYCGWLCFDVHEHDAKVAVGGYDDEMVDSLAAKRWRSNEPPPRAQALLLLPPPVRVGSTVETGTQVL